MSMATSPKSQEDFTRSALSMTLKRKRYYEAIIPDNE